MDTKILKGRDYLGGLAVGRIIILKIILRFCSVFIRLGIGSSGEHYIFPQGSVKCSVSWLCLKRLLTYQGTVQWSYLKFTYVG